jgi:hypothetical protein
VRDGPVKRFEYTFGRREALFETFPALLNLRANEEAGGLFGLSETETAMLDEVPMRGQGVPRHRPTR